MTSRTKRVAAGALALVLCHGVLSTRDVRAPQTRQVHPEPLPTTSYLPAPAPLEREGPGLTELRDLVVVPEGRYVDLGRFPTLDRSR